MRGKGKVNEIYETMCANKYVYYQANMMSSFYNFFLKTDSFQLFASSLKQFQNNGLFGKRCIELKRHLSEEKRKKSKVEKGSKRGGKRKGGGVGD